jgi:exodeoxyribonuclease VII large subunit
VRVRAIALERLFGRFDRRSPLALVAGARARLDGMGKRHWLARSAIAASARQKLERRGADLQTSALKSLQIRATRLGAIARALAGRSPQARLAAAAARRTAAGNGLVRARETDRLRRRERFMRLAGRLEAAAHVAARQRAQYPQRLDLALARLRRTIAGKVTQGRTRLDAAWQLVDALGYHKVLERGFALVRDTRGEPVRRAAGLVAEQNIRVQFADAEIGAQVRDDSAPVPERVSGKDARPKRGGGATGQGSLF